MLIADSAREGIQTAKLSITFETIVTFKLSKILTTVNDEIISAWAKRVWPRETNNVQHEETDDRQNKFFG